MTPNTDIPGLLARLKRAAAAIPDVRTGAAFSPEHLGWLGETMAVLEAAFTRESRYCQAFDRFTWRGPPMTVVTSADLERYGPDPRDTVAAQQREAFEAQMDTAGMLLQMAQFELTERAKNA